MQTVAKKLIKEIKVFKGHFAFALFCMFLSGLANIFPSWFVKISIDGLAALSEGRTSFNIVPTQIKNFSFVPQVYLDTNNLQYVLPVAIIGVFCVSAFLRFLYEFNIRKVGLLVVKNLREKFHSHINMLSLNTQMKYDSGSLVSRITSDMHSLQSWIAESLSNLFNDGFKALFMFVWLLALDWKLTMLSIVVIPLFALPVIKIGKRIRKYSKQGQDFIGGLTTFVTESIVNQRITKAFNFENKRQSAFVDESDTLFATHKKWVKFLAMVSPVTNIIASIGIGFILFLGLSSVTNNNISVGEFSSFFVTSILLFDPVKRIGRVSTIFQSAIGVSERIFSVLGEDIQKDEGHQRLSNAVEGEIEFKNVEYSYTIDSKTGDQANQKFISQNKTIKLFKDLNLKIPAKSSVAFVGPSGSGKTTLVSLIPRFFEIKQGEIAIDGINIEDINLCDLRRQISVVAQDPLLFSGSLRDNILIGKAEASEEEFAAAVANAHVAEFAENLEHGYDTHIGERGNALSVGQRQRVALARAFISDASILILDEPTSALDNESEAYIYDAVSKLKTDKTVLIVAHRLNTIKNCDRIVYIQDGEILESGMHDELLSKGGAYAKLLQEV